MVVYTNNKHLTYILCSGSGVNELHCLSLKICEICALGNIQFVTRWIPREDNIKADYLIRCLDSDDWLISDTVFQSLDS